MYKIEIEFLWITNFKLANNNKPFDYIARTLFSFRLYWVFNVLALYICLYKDTRPF